MGDSLENQVYLLFDVSDRSVMNKTPLPYGKKNKKTNAPLKVAFRMKSMITYPGANSDRGIRAILTMGRPNDGVFSQD